jgi:hypothetical protein
VKAAKAPAWQFGNGVSGSSLVKNICRIREGRWERRDLALWIEGGGDEQSRYQCSC